MIEPISRRNLLAGALAASLSGCAANALHQPPAPPRRRSMTMAAPDGRTIAISVLEPSGLSLGTVLFSHGALSAPEYYERILNPIVSAGYRVLAPLHVDSALHPRTRDYPGLASWRCRIEDMRALVDHLDGAPFVAMGHSYGGLIATVLGGAAGMTPEGLRQPLVPRLASSVIAFSPPAPIPVMMTAEGYGALAVPALIQTGTRDVPPGADAADDAWKGHLAPFDAARPGGDRYGLVLEGVDHYFGGAICDFTKPGPMQRDALDRAIAIAALFLNAHGPVAGRRAAAKRRLDARITGALPTRLERR